MSPVIRNTGKQGVRSIRQQNLRFYKLITAKTLKSVQALANNLKLSDQRVLDRNSLICLFFYDCVGKSKLLRRARPVDHSLGY
eukprot:566846-Rhodomonas_salina.1